MSIFDFVPPQYAPRPGQTAYWKWLETNWDNYDVFIVTAPTGAGKSLMNVVTAAYANSLDKTVALMAPRKFHQDQYANEFTHLPVLKGMSAYICHDCTYEGATCQAVKARVGRLCGQDCEYVRARMRAKYAKTCIFNFYSYFVNKMYKDVAIIDEGHGAVDLLYGLFGRKLWKCEMQYPDDMELTPAGISDFLTGVIDNLENRLLSFINNRMAPEQIEALQDEVDQVKGLRFALDTCPDDFLIRRKKGQYWGSVKHLRKSEQEYIYVKIMKVAGLGERILWPKDSVGKIILTSATIGPEDVEALGLAEWGRVGYYECQSEIPVENRYFIVDHAAPMTFKNRTESIPKIAKKILELCEVHKGQRGIVHATYAVAKELRPLLEHNRRFMFHDHKDKDETLQSFLATVKSRPDAVLLASGMSEGIDLKGDLARFQVCTMLQYPSLEDDVMAWIAHEKPDLYKWWTIRDLIQKAGRIVRGSEDWGTTYFIGSELTYDFYKRTERMWLKWFRAAMIWSTK